MDEKDQQALRAYMDNAPAPGQGVSEDRHVAVKELEAEHLAARVRRERLAADADWADS